jgi:hypothetical protein
MTQFDDDIAMAKRHSIAMDSDRCFGSNSQAPHAALKPLLARMRSARVRCLELEEEDEDLDPGDMAERLRVYADIVLSIITKCNASEKERRDDVFNAIDWYNANIAESEKAAGHMFTEGKKDAQDRLRPAFKAKMQQLRAELEGEIEAQKKMYEAQLAKVGSKSASNDGITTPPAKVAPASQLPTPSTTPAPPSSASPAEYKAQIAFWKNKYEHVAAQNAELRKSKSTDAELEKLKQHYEMQIQHHKSRADTLADTNTDLRRQLQRCESPREKRKADSDERSGGSGDSPKRAKSH